MEKTSIIIVLDRSGSMNRIKTDVIGGLNSFIKQQQDLPGECSLTVVQFDDQFETIYQNVLIKAVRPFDENTFVPRGSTALLDAIGQTINSVNLEIEVLPKSKQPKKTIFVILTDGEENCSRKFNRDQIFEMIELQKKNHQWEFVFLAANQDAIKTASLMGIGAASSMTFNTTTDGTRATYDALSASVGNYRSSLASSVYFNDDQRNSASK